MMLRFIPAWILTITLLCPFITSAQAPASKEIIHRKLAWFDAFENINIGEKWRFEAEVTERLFYDPYEHYNAGIRMYGMYKVGQGWRIGQGFSVWFPQSGGTKTYELRPAQQFYYKQNLKHVNFSHRFLIEERIVRNVANGEVVDGYAFYLRFRYRLAFEDTLAKMGAKDRILKFVINDEVFLQGGKNVITNVFDQNRFYVGLSAEFAKKTSITVCYGNLFRPIKPAGTFEDNHILRVSFTHEFDIKKKKSG